MGIRSSTWLATLCSAAALCVPVAAFTVDRLGDEPLPESCRLLVAGGGSWTSNSERNAREAVRPVDVRAVLDRVVAMPLTTWQYTTQDAKNRHMVPMAQDFYAAFGLGESDTGIDSVDADGVALAAIQGLSARLDARDHEIAELRAQVAALAAAIRRPAGDGTD